MRWIGLGMGTLMGCGLLMGCGTTAPPKPPTAGLASQPCAKVAQIRMEDARLNGADARIQQITFRGTYTDCVAWEAKGYKTIIP
jgi:hypothetical protein